MCLLKFTCNINVIEDVFLSVHKILKSGLFTKVVILKKIIIDHVIIKSWSIGANSETKDK